MLRTFLSIRSNLNQHILKLTTQFRYYANEQEQKELDVVLEENKHTEESHALLGKYTQQEKEKILQIVNDYNLKQLLRYDITKGRANKLLSHRTRKGFLKNLNDIFLVEGFGIKVVDKFYQSLLQEPEALDVNLTKPQQVKTTTFITPSMESVQRASVKSCVSVRIGVNSITWSRLELSPADLKQPCLLTHWQLHELPEKKLHLNDVIQICLYVSYLIPAADCYLFENPQFVQPSNNSGSGEQQNISIQKSQIMAIIGYALAARNTDNQKALQNGEKEEKYTIKYPSLFYVRRYLSARLFSHLVGNERVSSEQTILDMMRTYYNTQEMDDDEQTKSMYEKRLNFRRNIQFPMELRHMFRKAKPFHRELLSQALLLNLTFVRLVLLQDAESIAKVARGRNEPNEEV